MTFDRSLERKVEQMDGACGDLLLKNRGSETETAGYSTPAMGDAKSRGPRMRSVGAFVAISALILIPCFWRPRIEAGDLASHIYNAWLSVLIHEGKAPGLQLVRQPTNILFDYSLNWLFVRFGAAAAQRIAVSGSVLIFFWGAFAAVWTLGRRRPWFVLPCLVMLTYGVIFHMGSFNCYIALGLSFFALALLWRRPNFWRWAVSASLLALAWLGHPLPPLWVLSALVYDAIARRFSVRARLVQFLVAMLLLIGLREFVMFRFSATWSPKQIVYATGADQVVLGFGWPYRLMFVGLAGIWAIWLFKAARSRGYLQFASSVTFQLYALCVLAAFLFPHQLLVSSYTLGDTPQRFSIIAGVLICAVLSKTLPGVWMEAALVALALLFFARLYVDTGRMNQLEAKVESIVAQFPKGQRVIGSFHYPPERGFDISMILDRACVGKCFDFGNYEPSMQQFRVRASPGNNIAAWNQTDPVPLQYQMSHWHEPLYEIYRCGEALTELCVRHLK